jgi:eukaryotic-like serine/threonine-protein kinase
MTSGGNGGPTGSADAGSDADPLLGKLLSERYQVVRKLGEGGMAAVYLAEHIVIQKKVALKILAPELARREELAARFLQEARAASRIGQENVIDISDFGRADGLPFFVMEYLEGHDLGELLRRNGAIAWPRARNILVQICRALRAAHTLGIIHRDLKPENVFLLQREGRSDFVKLLDFGIAKVPGDASSAEGPRLTRTGMIFGTPEYMAPEQAEGKPADHRADLYAAGCVLYHCLTGTAPFAAESFMAMLTKHLVEAVVPPSVRRPELGIPPAVDALVARALEKDRDRRFGSADEFMAAVQSISDSGVALAPAGAQAPGRSTTPVRVSAPVGNPAAMRTEVFPPPRQTMPMPEAPPTTGAPLRRFSILAAVGIAVGVAVAALFVILRRAPEATSPPAASTSAAPAPSPTPARVAPTAETPAAVGGGPSETPTAPASPAAGKAGVGVLPAAAKPGSARPSGEEGGEGKVKGDSKRAPRPPGSPVRAAPAAPAPSDLKPFPGG